MSRPHPSPDLLCRFFSLGLAIVLLLIGGTLKNSAAPLIQSQPATISLELSKPIVRTINAGETDSYTLSLTAGQYAHLTVDQRGVDVVVSIFTPDGAKVVRVDMPNGDKGVEPVFLVAESSGAYRVEVLSTSPKRAGNYEVKLEELRTATEPDRNRLAAQTLFTEAKALRNERDSRINKQSRNMRPHLLSGKTSTRNCCKHSRFMKSGISTATSVSFRRRSTHTPKPRLFTEKQRARAAKQMSPTISVGYTASWATLRIVSRCMTEQRRST